MIVLGIKEPEVQKKLLKIKNLAFNKAINCCRAAEVMKTQTKIYKKKYR